jgi:DNA-binding CsgD family transcriptional regulator
LVLRGEAGIGKTALLEHLVESASDLTVVRAVGVESEMELAFASLQLLCAPLLDRLERLPGPQRDALGVVFGLDAGPAPDRFLVGLGVLGLLSEVAEERPVLCVVDDAQWLDEASALTLAFVSRRLLAVPVGMVFAAREPGDELRYLPELHVQGLGGGDARELLDWAVRFKLDERLRERIIAETRGNPLALLELPRGLTATELAGGFGLLESERLSGRIEQSFVRRLENLSAEERRLLLLAAAEPVGDPILLWRAAERLGIAAATADAAEAQGLLAIGERATFRHPLVRSAVYRSATAEERRAVHLALAETTDREADPDRRAWHLAAAAVAPNEEVALELERSAGRAQARGGLAAATAFLRRSVSLTADPARRVNRAVAAAEAGLQAGAFDAARALLSTAEVGPLDERQRARVELLRGHIALFSTFASDAPSLLLRAARRLERVDARLARETYLDAWGAALYAGRVVPEGTLVEISRAARAAPRPDGPPRAADLLLDGVATLVTDGRAAAARLLEEATRMFADDQVPAVESLRWGWLTAVPTWALWDEESAYTLCVRQLRALREAGALARLPLDLQTFSVLAVRCGDFASAADAIGESEAIQEATGTRVAPFSAMMLAVLRGREAEATAMIGGVREESLALRQGTPVQLTDWMLAILGNSLGRYEEALVAAQQASNDRPEEMFVSAWAALELLEAAIRSDSQEVARIALERIVAATAFAVTDSARGILARSRALASVGETAESLYREAIERLGRTRLRPELARAHLLYGEWLRREGRRVDARAELRLAHEQLVTIGMEAFADRARRELMATGENVRKRIVEIRDDLTPQEAQIARLARDGLSNAEIGGRLFISQHTVAYHLRKVFSKLDITSRNQLDQALPERARVGEVA